MSKSKPYVPVQTFPVKARRAAPPASGDFRSCSACEITFRGSADDAECPMCDQGKEMDALREQIYTLGQENGMLRQELSELRARVDLMDALRQALQLVEPVDLAELKSFAYLRRDDELLRLYVRRKLQVGKPSRPFLVATDDQGRYIGEFMPTTVGGVAFLGTLAEVERAYGAATASRYYMESLATYLAA